LSKEKKTKCETRRGMVHVPASTPPHHVLPHILAVPPDALLQVLADATHATTVIFVSVHRVVR